MRETHNGRLELVAQKSRERWMGFEDWVTAHASGTWSVSSHLWKAVAARPLVLRWTLVVTTVTIATVVGLVFRSYVSVPSQLMLLIPAVFVSALYGGLIAGVAASLLGASATIFYFMNLPHSSSLQADLVSLALYGLACSMVLGLGRAQERHREELRRMADSLEQRVSDRTREVQAAHDELAGFCYSISHDLRAPMRNIIGSSRILVEEAQDRLTPEVSSRLTTMSASAQRLSDLVDALLGHARLASTDIQPEWVDLTEAADLVCANLLQQVWTFSSVSVETQPGLVVAGDRVLVKLVLRSLLENAFKYAKPGEPLRVLVEETRREGRLWVCVKDNGIGFDSQYAGRIFEPFQRLHRDSEYPGTGIGLANVKRIIERHGGEIKAEGAPGKGSSFLFNFGPLAPVERRPIARAQLP